ncbi:hypothetical protein ACHAXS_007544 [Conticribra weissflogii]
MVTPKKASANRASTVVHNKTISSSKCHGDARNDDSTPRSSDGAKPRLECKMKTRSLSTSGKDNFIWGDFCGKPSDGMLQAAKFSYPKCFNGTDIDATHVANLHREDYQTLKRQLTKEDTPFPLQMNAATIVVVSIVEGRRMKYFLNDALLSTKDYVSQLEKEITAIDHAYELKQKDIDASRAKKCKKIDEQIEALLQEKERLNNRYDRRAIDLKRSYEAIHGEKQGILSSLQEALKRIGNALDDVNRARRCYKHLHKLHSGRVKPAAGVGEDEKWN